MTSLADVYEGKAGRVASRRQQLVGTGLFLAGVAGLVGAIALATTGLGSLFGLGDYAAREVAGVVAGIGLPAVVLGIFTLLPAGPRTRVVAGAGAAVSLLGVVGFQHVYPYNWMANTPLLALGVSTLYFTGVLTTFWCLFAALAMFKIRNDPGGTARMKVTEEGTIKLIEENTSVGSAGGIGLFGREPDGSVETQTNRRDSGRGKASDGNDGSELLDQTASKKRSAAPTGDSGTRRSQSRQERTPQGPSERELDSTLANAGPESTPTTDGGTTAATGRDTITETAVHRGEPDNYCGNCRHFQYVMDDNDDIQPYCSYHEELLDDMDACSAWVDND